MYIILECLSVATHLLSYSTQRRCISCSVAIDCLTDYASITGFQVLSLRDRLTFVRLHPTDDDSTDPTGPADGSDDQMGLALLAREGEQKGDEDLTMGSDSGKGGGESVGDPSTNPARRVRPSGLDADSTDSDGSDDPMRLELLEREEEQNVDEDLTMGSDSGGGDGESLVDPSTNPARRVHTSGVNADAGSQQGKLVLSLSDRSKCLACKSGVLPLSMVS